MFSNVKIFYDNQLNEKHTFFEFVNFSSDINDKFYLHIFNAYDDTLSTVYKLNSISDQMSKNGKIKYTLIIEKDLTGKYYGLEVHKADPESQQFPKNTIIADPYSKAVATKNHYSPINKSIIIDSYFDWEGDKPLDINHRELIIYEAHLKDMTAHSSSKVKSDKAGTYLGFIEKMQNGGIVHMKEMGYNAIEFLPIFEFANVEIPFLDSTQFITNTWNPYEENHWGYMPTFFFAPEGSYSSSSSNDRGRWNGTKGLQVNEFKELVKVLHDNNIAVILDVVYNHVSQYDFNPFKQLNKKNYFRQTEDGDYTSLSGCGNDLKTEDDFISNIIIESISYWMKEYHIDGFRFDLGKLIDWQTIEKIETQAKIINPNVFLTCEPWGDGYDPNGFSNRNWSSWNDQFRNALKGWHPDGNGGYIFGKWHPGYENEKLNRVFAGSPRELGGQYIDIAHSLNYLESHDDYTLGDFIRIETGKVDINDSVENIPNHHILTDKEIRIHKLAATALLTSQGPVMIAQGQEWGRSKVIAKTKYPDPNIGKIDHNSYEKDNETNWLNWDHKNLNLELVNFYKQLIHLRKTEKAFTHTDYENIEFIKSINNDLGIGYELKPENDEAFLIIMNSSLEIASFKILKKNWNIEITNNSSSLIFNNKFVLDAQSIAIFRGNIID